MIFARTIADVATALGHPAPGTRVGFVPTMGAFHAGHVSLFSAARRDSDIVVVSLFVNPSQFGDPTDLFAYPRDEARDASMAEAAGVDVLFVPSVEEMYPEGFETWIDLGQLSRVLEGEFRPGHFRGVATVCLKLFHIVKPTHAYFGQKDAQQVEVIRRMVRDLNLDLELSIQPTLRDPDGLAMSSRNVRLSPDARAKALALPRALATRDPEKARQLLHDVEVEYVEVAPFDPPVLAAAIRVGGVRLIDNVRLDGGSS
jgi:pantoate--beta-alanine ligase